MGCSTSQTSKQLEQVCDYVKSVPDGKRRWCRRCSSYKCWCSLKQDQIKEQEEKILQASQYALPTQHEKDILRGQRANQRNQLAQLYATGRLKDAADVQERINDIDWRLKPPQVPAEPIQLVSELSFTWGCPRVVCWLITEFLPFETVDISEAVGSGISLICTDPNDRLYLLTDDFSEVLVVRCVWPNFEIIEHIQVHGLAQKFDTNLEARDLKNMVWDHNRLVIGHRNILQINLLSGEATVYKKSQDCKPAPISVDLKTHNVYYCSHDAGHIFCVRPDLEEEKIVHIPYNSLYKYGHFPELPLHVVVDGELFGFSDGPFRIKLAEHEVVEDYVRDVDLRGLPNSSVICVDSCKTLWCGSIGDVFGFQMPLSHGKHVRFRKFSRQFHRYRHPFNQCAVVVLKTGDVLDDGGQLAVFCHFVRYRGRVVLMGRLLTYSF